MRDEQSPGTAPAPDPGRRIPGLATSSSDVSEQRVREAAHRDADALLRSAFLATNEGVVVQSPTGEIIDANPAAERILGLTLDQMAGRTSADPRWRAEHADGSPFPSETHPAMVTLATGEPQRDVLMVVRKPWGERTRIRINSEPIRGEGPRPAAVVTTFVDVTPFHEAEARLQALLDRADDLFNNAPCGYHSLGPDGTYLEINDTELSWLGLTRDEVVGRRRPSDFMTESGRATFGKLFPELNRGVPALAEVDLVHRDGSRRRLSVRATAVLGPDGRFERSRAVMYDISELAAARGELEAHLRDQGAMLDNDLVPIMVAREHRVAWINRAAERMFGYAHGELVGQPSRVLYGDEAAQVEAVLKFRAALQADGVARMQLELKKKDGGPLQVDVFANVMPGQAGNLMFYIDLSPFREAERRLQASHRMESVARLAGGVAHELNNMLQVIGGSAEMLGGEPLTVSSRSCLLAIDESVRRSVRLVQQLTAYAGNHASAPAVIGVDEPVRNALVLFGTMAAPDVRLEWVPCDRPWRVRADASLVTQAVTSLLLNARDAIRTTGRIVVRASTVTFAGERSPLNPDAHSGDFVCVAVEDDGEGMSADALEHAFEPFYTTQPFGGNHGLGLASVFGIARQAGGWVALESAPGSGTVATIVLPRVA